MLLILYGVLSRMGYNVREHLKKSGFQLITKFNMAVSAKDISFLAEIKRVYADKVRLIYTYIDDNTLKDIIGQLDITEEEAKTRYEIGCCPT